MIPWFSLLVWVAAVGSTVGFRPSAFSVLPLTKPSPPAEVMAEPGVGEPVPVMPAGADARLAERAAIVLT